jgi:hypothetical protein
LVVLVVGGVALGALLLHPGVGLWAKGRGPLGGNRVVVVGLALLSLLGGLGLRERYRGRIGGGRELGPVEQRLADGVRRVLAGASLVVPLLVLVLYRFGSSGGGQKGGLGRGLESSPLPRPRQDPVPAPPAAAHGGHAGHGAQFGLARVLLGLGIVAVVVVVVVAGLRVWRYVSRPVAPEVLAVDVGLDEQERLADAVDRGRRALLEGTDARAAVIACYAAMEESLAESGVIRRASDSPQELLERAVAGGLPSGAAAVALTALFREARYSTHPMDGSHRDRAEAALADIAEGLRLRATGVEAAAGTS